MSRPPTNDFETPIDNARHAARVVATNTAYFFADRILSAGLSFLTFVSIARLYGPTALGQWGYASLAVQLATPLLAAGAEPILIKELVSRQKDSGSLLGTSFGLLGATTVIGLGVSFVWLTMSDKGDATVSMLGLLFTLAGFFNISMVFEIFFKALSRPIPIICAHLGCGLFGLAIRLILMFGHAPIAWVGIGVLLEAIATLTVLAILYKTTGGTIISWRFDSQLAYDLVRQSAPVVLSSFSVLIFFRLTYIMLGHFSNYSEVGNLSAAASIVAVLGLSSSAISSAAYPRLVRVALENRDRFFDEAAAITYLLTIIGFAMLAVALLCCPLLPYVFGARFTAVEPVLAILSFVIVINASGSGRALAINALGVNYYHLISAGSGLIAVIAIGLFVIPRYLAIGAACADVAGALVAAVLTTAFLPEISPLARVQLLAFVGIPPKNLIRPDKLFRSLLRRSRGP